MKDVRIYLVDLSKSDLQLTRTKITTLVREGLDRFDGLIKRRDLSVDYLDNYPPSVSGPVIDPSLMKLVINNLIENAAKYSARGETISIEIGIDRGAWFFFVTDIGRFIPATEYKSIFRPSQRLPAPKGQQDVPGTGLGLSAVWRIVYAHDSAASIDVESVYLQPPLGGGTPLARTTFRVKVCRNLSA